MTAPLPPLPVTDYALASLGGPYEPERITSMDGYSDEHMNAYAKLSVREALERAIAPCTAIVDFFHGSENMHPLHIRERDTAKEIADAIRAMLKEYSDD